MREELLKGLTEEQIKKVEACKNSDEILALAKTEGVQLSDEQLEAVSGGGCKAEEPTCPKCKSKNIRKWRETMFEGKMRYDFACDDCGHKWYTQGY